MSANILWGEAKLAGALQPITDVAGSPILDVDNVAITTVTPQVILENLLDVNGDPILDVNNVPIEVIASASVPPKYWQTADVSSDGGLPFAFLWQSNAWQPAAQGGENQFVWLFLTLSWSMAATIRVQASVDGSRATVALPGGGSVVFIDSIFNLSQETGTLQRRSAIFPVPLVRETRDAAGNPLFRSSLRGERLQFTIESDGPLGVGELMLEGCDVEYAPLRKAIFETVQT